MSPSAGDDDENRVIISGSFSGLADLLSFRFVNNRLEVIDPWSHKQQRPYRRIILKLNMLHMNGPEPLRELKSCNAFAEIPVIISSASVKEIEKNE